LNLDENIDLESEINETVERPVVKQVHVKTSHLQNPILTTSKCIRITLESGESVSLKLHTEQSSAFIVNSNFKYNVG
jgi:hypothetical protein